MSREKKNQKHKNTRNSFFVKNPDSMSANKTVPDKRVA